MGPQDSNISTLSSHPLHGLSPYVGRLAAHRAADLVHRLAANGNTIADPFCGSGTIPLEAWKAGLNVLASDLSPYAIALTRAKLFPISTLDVAMCQIEEADKAVAKQIHQIDLRSVPTWIRQFYHLETLREAIAWSNVLKKRKQWFLFGCFLNLLHHQRSGFLSYPASHATPYLRKSKFPEDQFPEMYEYRDVRSRLVKKVIRTLKEPVQLDYGVSRIVKHCNATNLSKAAGTIDTIITSPPYMSGLDYARDNRLRLWFCGVTDWTELEGKLSPPKRAFANLMNTCVSKWQHWLRPKGHLAVVLGDIHQDNRRVDVAMLVQQCVRERAPLLEVIATEDQAIPNEKRLIKGNAGTVTETTLIFRRKR